MMNRMMTNPILNHHLPFKRLKVPGMADPKLPFLITLTGNIMRINTMAKRARKT
jgi:hypothetical protein